MHACCVQGVLRILGSCLSFQSRAGANKYCVYLSYCHSLNIIWKKKALIDHFWSLILCFHILDKYGCSYNMRESMLIIRVCVCVTVCVIGSGFTLDFPKIRTSDAGTYTCRASNHAQTEGLLQVDVQCECLNLTSCPHIFIYFDDACVAVNVGTLIF